MAATQSSISPSSRHAQNPRSQLCSPSNSSSPIIKSPDASFGCRLSSIWKSSSSPAIRHLLFRIVKGLGDGLIPNSKFDIHNSPVVFQEVQHDPVELFRLLHIGQVCRAVHDDFAHVRKFPL